MLSIGLLAVYLSTLAGISSTLVSKKMVRLLGNKLASMATVGISIVPLIIGIFLFGSGSVTQNDIIISLLAGFFLALGFIFRYKALASEQLTNVWILGQIQPAMILISGIFIFKESISTLGLVSIALVFLGSLFIVANEKMEINRKLIPGVLTGACWGIYWVLIIAVVNGGGGFLGAIFASRVSGIIVMLAFLFTFRSSITSGAKAIGTVNAKSLLGFALLLGIISGLSNGAGDSLFGLAASYKIAAIGTVINTAVGMIIVVVFAYFFYKERLTRMEKVGFAIMVLGTILLNFA